MKYITLLFVCWTAMLSAQGNNDLVSDSILYLTSEQAAYMLDKETSYLLKSSPLAFEKKLNTSWSMNMLLAPVYSESRGIHGSVGVELRHYYKLGKLVKEKKQADNLSSVYVGALFQYTGDFRSSESLFSNNLYEYGIAWGSQKRFLNYGYIDYGATLKYNDYQLILPIENGDYSARSVFLSSRMNVGFALGKRHKLSDNIKCPIFKCYIDRSSVLKINFNSIYTVGVGYRSTYDNTFFAASINPNFSYEHKIGSSSFSFNHDLSFTLSTSSEFGADRNEFGITKANFEYEGGIRHYFRLRSKINKGESGNNLAGMYWTVNFQWSIGEDNYVTDTPGQTYTNSYNQIKLPIGFGYQKMILDGYYFDFQIGVQPLLKSYNGFRFRDEGTIYTNFKVGKFF